MFQANNIKKWFRLFLYTGVILIMSEGVGQADPQWGKWKKDHCSKPGYRQYSSVLENIPFGHSWEVTCRATPVNKQKGIQGLPYDPKLSRPPRCITKSMMWGEIDVRDKSCDVKISAPKMQWGAFKKDHCTQNNKRQWSSVLHGIPPSMSWQEACSAAARVPYAKGSYPKPLIDRLTVTKGEDPNSSLPDRCKEAKTMGMSTGIWGEFDIADNSCKINYSDLTWGTWADKGCVHVNLSLSEQGTPSGPKDLRQYASVLWGIPPGYSWENACKNMPVRIEAGVNSIVRDRADVCVRSSMNDLLKAGNLIAATGAGLISGIGTPASIGIAATGAAIDLVLSNEEAGAINMWGLVYVDDGSCPVQ
jgi:hypothetical protein